MQPLQVVCPHSGVIYLKKEYIASLDFNNTMCDDIAEGGRRFHMGTPQYETLAGVTAAVNFIADEGEKYAEYFEDELKGLTGRRRNIVAGVLAMDTHEMALAKKLRMGLRAIPDVTVYGPAEGQPRTPTVSFTMEGYAPEQVTEVFGSKGINSWHGDFYAVKAVAALGGRYDLPHGVANAILPPTVTEYNLPANTKKYADVACAMGLDVHGRSDEEAAAACVDGLRRLCADVGIKPMREHPEIKPEDFHALSVAAMANVSNSSNPREMTAEAYEELFKKAYAGE